MHCRFFGIWDVRFLAARRVSACIFLNVQTHDLCIDSGWHQKSFHSNWYNDATIRDFVARVAQYQNL